MLDSVDSEKALNLLLMLDVLKDKLAASGIRL